MKNRSADADAPNKAEEIKCSSHVMFENGLNMGLLIQKQHACEQLSTYSSASQQGVLQKACNLASTHLACILSVRQCLLAI